jgi:uncharacterized protein YcsI (UPF0317 family)
MTPSELRKLSSTGEFNRPTVGYCEGYVQANLVALPEEYARDFERFCRQNPKPCPLLEVVGPGSFSTHKLANKADLRTVIPRYRVWIDGEPRHEIQQISEFYQDDLVFFLLGCSFSFESALMKAGISLRHVAEKKNVSMYNTSIDLESVGIFQGKMVVSMRPIRYDKIVKACLITAHYPEVHGAPVHIGYPEMIGITNVHSPDYGDSVTIHKDEIPVFWACGVTPQNVLVHAKLPFAITHSPGHMFIGDLKDEEFYREML